MAIAAQSSNLGVPALTRDGTNFVQAYIRYEAGSSGNIVASFPHEVGFISDANGVNGYTLNSNTDATSNITVGLESGLATTTALDNVFMGFKAGLADADGGDNTFIGYEAGYSNISGTDNVSIGSGAGKLDTGGANVFIGFNSCKNATASSNVCIGQSIGPTLTTGGAGILIGSPGNFVDRPAAATTYYLNIGNLIYGNTNKGILGFRGPTAVIATNACGSVTQGTLKAGSNDVSGEITVGTTSVTSCAISFANTHSVAPNCVVSSQVAGTVVGFGYTASTTALTVTATSGFDSTKFDYFCPAAATANNPAP
jgi:hypothetical protein